MNSSYDSSTDNNTYESPINAEFDNIEIIPIKQHRSLVHWFHQQTKHFGLRTLIICLAIASCFLVFLLFIILRLQYTNRRRRRQKKFAYKSNNGESKRYSIAPPDGRDSKKRVPKLLRYLHTNEAKPNAFRLSTNGGESYHLIASIQDTKNLPYRNSDCVLNEHCCIHSSLSQPVPTSSYHQLNRMMLSGSDPPLPLPLPNHTQHSNSIDAGVRRSMKKDIDNSSVQTYSAVYSCDLAANLDFNHDFLPKQSSIKRRSILKTTNSSLIQPKIIFLYAKNLVDCHALQSINRTSTDPILLATADENRIQLSQAFVRIFCFLHFFFSFFHSFRREVFIVNYHWHRLVHVTIFSFLSMVNISLDFSMK